RFHLNILTKEMLPVDLSPAVGSRRPLVRPGLTRSLCPGATALRADRLLLFRCRPLSAILACKRRLGRGRARFWRQLDFPNVVRARETKARKREERLRALGESDSQLDAVSKKGK